MGCGSGHAGGEVPFDGHRVGNSLTNSSWLRRFEKKNEEVNLLEVPSGIVLCSASRPDWGSLDHFVFETKDFGVDLSPPSTAGDPFRPGTPGAFQEEKSTWVGRGAHGNVRLSSVKDGEVLSAALATVSQKHSDEKGGRFFSKRQDCVGTWRIQGNVLTLCWPYKLTVDSVVASETPRQWINKQTKLTVNVLEPQEENPRWFRPDIIADKYTAENVSSKQFECPVCYFELYKFQGAVIRLHSRRCCGHYFHKDCAHYLLRHMKGSGRSATCPLCGVSFSEVKDMPDLARDPRDWFSVVDVDFGGELDTNEVIDALGSVLPVSRHKLEKAVKAHWHEWDPDGDGTITLQEFIMPKNGLKDWVLSHLTMLAAVPSAIASSVPSLDRSPREWFHYWDRDGNGTLEKDEVIRALCRSFCRNENGQPVLRTAHDMREISESLWTSLGYSPFDAVNFQEFVRPYGLLDQFLQNQLHCMYFGVDAAETI